MQSGGIYVNTATQFNTKCVVFGTMLAAGYWYLPAKKNPFMLPVIFTIAYVAMAWYDELYNCESRLYSGSSSWGAAILDSIFKPQLRQSDNNKNKKIPHGKNLVTNQEIVYRRYMYLFHMLVVAPLFAIVGYYKTQRLYLPLLGFGLLGMFYHLYRTIKPRPEQSQIIYPSHTFVFLPLALYIGWKGAKSNKLTFNGLLGLGIMAGMYHSIGYLQLR